MASESHSQVVRVQLDFAPPEMHAQAAVSTFPKERRLTRFPSTRASGVVSMAFANTGVVSLCTIFSKMFPPGDNDLVKMLGDDLADLASQARRTVVLELLQDVGALWLPAAFSFGRQLLAREENSRTTSC
jgi:hypothetical protein